MAAITAPGPTPALALATTLSRPYPRATLSASARDISPKSGQSTSSTPRERSITWRRGIALPRDGRGTFLPSSEASPDVARIIAWLLPRDVDDNFSSARRWLPARGD